LLYDMMYRCRNHWTSWWPA